MPKKKKLNPILIIVIIVVFIMIAGERGFLGGAGTFTRWIDTMTVEENIPGNKYCSNSYDLSTEDDNKRERWVVWYADLTPWVGRRITDVTLKLNPYVVASYNSEADGEFRVAVLYGGDSCSSCMSWNEFQACKGSGTWAKGIWIATASSRQYENEIFVNNADLLSIVNDRVRNRNGKVIFYVRCISDSDDYCAGYWYQPSIEFDWEDCQCSSGTCCDGCNYRTSSYTCGTQSCDSQDTECRDYHNQDMHCTGSSSDCLFTNCDSYTNKPSGTSCSGGECDGSGSCAAVQTCATLRTTLGTAITDWIGGGSRDALGTAIQAWVSC